MLSPVKGFMLSLFNLFLVWIVFANFLGWSGGYVDVVGQTDYNWGNSYFGFESLLRMSDDFMFRMESLEINGFNLTSMSSFNLYMKNLLNSILAGIPNAIQKIQNKTYNPNLDSVILIVTLLLQPILVTANLFMCLACILWWVICGMLVMLNAFGGAYNVPYNENNDVWNQWSYLDSEWNWDSIISYVRMNVRPLLDSVYGGARGDFTPVKIY